MLAGRRFWIVIWSGIFLLGSLGIGPSLYWGRRTRWRNIDELLRAVGTVLVSAGMLLLLLGAGGLAGQVLLLVSVGCFVGAFVAGRRPQVDRPVSASGAVSPSGGNLAMPIEASPPAAGVVSSRRSLSTARTD